MTVDWSELQQRAERARVAEDVQPHWDDMPSLHEIFGGGAWRITNEDVSAWPVLYAVARRYLLDLNRFHPYGNSDFLDDMVLRIQRQMPLTDGQVRGVINVLGGHIRRNRARFWKSRDRRRDRFDGRDNCLVCGGPLTGDVPVARGLGETCYRRVLGG